MMPAGSQKPPASRCPSSAPRYDTRNDPSPDVPAPHSRTIRTENDQSRFAGMTSDVIQPQRAGKALAIAVHFIRRELRNRYLGSVSGGLWALLQPLMQLAIY